ncbi:hypothetical protein CWB96_18630 [Pseudoalteromonas citrea]|uniref:Tail specific protease domain-containing protein n=1 Tax=Pseudoalteromonas citrea TaxID=43655 RepID=A0A5S3XJL3_9GAMM|nr:S41 family peptidase [Pseudoalteromonas citrea]TMP38320.1 hypothetical protein CWB97_22110 [Pseudoalteromonas citrea]TMP54752.1 hypothetical protein CWB96_18630 [Pseudoalteromonas citrea]
MFKKTLLATLISIAGISSASAQFSLLSETRNDITFPEYTTQERQIVLDQAKLLLDDLYVHKYEKDIYYGTSPNQTGHLSPVASLNALIAQADSLSTEELNIRLQEIFLSQRDLHLNYNFPQPYSNFYNFLPVRFAQTVADSGEIEVRLSSISTRYLNFAPEIAQATAGDKVISYNGTPIIEAVENNIVYGGGSNPHAGFVRALDKLRGKSQRSQLIPEADSAVLVLESHLTGKQYSIDVPWVTYNYAPTTSSTSNTADLAAATEESTDEYAKLSKALLKQSGMLESGVLANQATADNTLSWSIIPVDGKNVGYLHIDSFSPSTSPNEAVAIIQGLLDNELSTTDALVIDVRDNPGGNIIYADTLFQLFSPKQVVPTSLRYINTEVNQYIMQDTIFRTFGENWVKVLTDVEGTEAKYTDVATYRTTPQINTVGQAYYKPVGVWSNARTYSSGDVFTCGMQDNNVATIFGEHPSTGAGGANVIAHNIFNQYIGAPFEALPHGQDMRVSWRQMVRSGHNQNSLIEDHGCKADINVSYNLENILNNSTTNFNTIAQSLLSQPLPNATVSFAQPRYETNANLNGVISFETHNTELVDVYINGAKVERLPVFAYGQSAKTVEYTLPADLQGTTVVKFVGLDSGKTPVWNSTRYVF